MTVLILVDLMACRHCVWNLCFGSCRT